MKKSRLVHGVGVNDADYAVTRYDSFTEGGIYKQKMVWMCPIYNRWKGMLERCYSIKKQQIRPTYTSCTVCEDWLTFSNFRAWMETQDWEGKEIDKDILFPGNKVYSPETCVFIDSETNVFVLERGKSRGEYPIGVSFYKQRNKFVSNCCFKGRQKFLGLYDTPEEAHQAWLKEKLRLAHLLAAEQTDPRVAKALIERYENYNMEEVV